MAVIIQRMIAPVAAGVALTADPINGDRHAGVVTAVRGIGERLVSGAAIGDEWVVRGNVATARRRPEHAISRRQAINVAKEARRIADARGTPQDIEWAIDADGALWILQVRPMTALPPDVSWDSPAPGAYTRMLRFGEWIGEPVTPLFESWLLTAMEDRMHALFREWMGQIAPRPYHVVVNGWYFYSINFLSGGAFLRSLPGMLVQLARSPRHLAGVIPPTVRHSFPVFERKWRVDLQPRYRAAVADAERRGRPCLSPTSPSSARSSINAADRRRAGGPRGDCRLCRRLLPDAWGSPRGARRSPPRADRRRAGPTIATDGAGPPGAAAAGRAREPDGPAVVGQLPWAHRRPSVGHGARVRCACIAGPRQRTGPRDPRT